ncbi:MAG: SUMF1/EgtB/PvdO family nonheme iron enzyme, partial [Deltaproteobacteria bacterium]|nr:SUMF1/EgtB/PvdO family nonheme iron enzyme [Deltaproteobacteria bacterium]
SRRTRAGEGLQFLRRHCEESGLLTSRGDDRFGFLHHGFQEFLAARHVEHERLLDVLAQRFGQSWWQEVILLLLGIGDQSLFESFMAKVLRLPGIVDQRELLGRCVSDAKATSIKPFIDFVRRGRERPDNQLVALETLAELDKEAVKRLRKELRGHPSQEIRIWFASRQVELAQKVAIDEPSGIELVLIPEGSFLMGSPDSEQGRFDWEGPVHEVTVSSFYLGKYPVTNAAYEKFLKANTNVQAPEYWGDDRYNQPNQPVVGVSWNEARKYCEWAGLRLPSEAEWEYACRAGTRTRYYTGDSQSDLDKAGWYYGNSGGRPHSVGEKEPNRFGLYDMHGNVCEWCEDDWHHSYEGAPVDGSAWVKNPRAEDRVSRGGSWGGVARDCRSAFRDGWGPGVRGGGLGFRPARSFP